MLREAVRLGYKSEADALLCVMIPELEESCRAFYAGSGEKLVDKFNPELVGKIRDKMVSWLDRAISLRS